MIEEKKEKKIHPDDKVFIDGIVNNDDKVVREFVQSFQNKIFRLCIKYVHNEDEALDMVQDVFGVILKKIEQFRGDSRLSTWIYSITVFTCIGYLRKKKKKNETSIDEYTQNSDIDSEYLLNKYTYKEMKANPLEDGELRKESERVLMKEIENLPVDYKAVFILKELEGLSIKEIQSSISISEAAIKTRLHRARLYLRNKLVQYFEEYKS